MRLDKAVALAGLSRSEARKAIQGGRVLVDGAPARDPAMQVEPGRVRLDGGGAIEAGELLECFQWSPDYDLQAVKEELADVVNYCIGLADKLDLDLKACVLEKLEKNAAKYPVEKARGKADKYDQLARE